MKTYKIGLIGKDVSKSSSQKIHGFIAKSLGISIEYEKMSIPENEFEDRIKNVLSSFDGFNVTIPYKLAVIPYLNSLEGDAKAMGAVNTVKTDGLQGYNTDGVGFELMLLNENINPKDKKVLILGGGGAGRSVACTLSRMGAKVYIYDRHKEKREEIATTFKNVTAIEEVVPYHAISNISKQSIPLVISSAEEAAAEKSERSRIYKIRPTLSFRALVRLRLRCDEKSRRSRTYKIRPTLSFRALAEKSRRSRIYKICQNPYYMIINATGVGMHGSVGQSPVDEDIIRECEVAVDLIYEPSESKFLQIAKEQNKKTLNGYAMLFYQAYYADCIYFNKTAKKEEAKKLFEEFKKTL